MDINTLVGQRIAGRRRRKGWYQRDLAAELGVSESWVSQVERGVIPLDSMKTAERLARILSTTVQHILAFDERYPDSDEGAHSATPLTSSAGGMSRRAVVPVIGLPIATAEAVAELLAGAAGEALDFTRQAEAGLIGAGTLDHLQLAIAEFDIAYSTRDPNILFSSVLRYRRDVNRLIAGPHTLRQGRELFVYAAWLSETLAWLANDLGDAHAGAAFAADAYTHATEAEHGELAAWAMDAAASIALYRGRPGRAVDFARRGQLQAPADHPLAVRMRAQAARALAASGDGEGYDEAFADARKVFELMPVRTRDRFGADVAPLAEAALTSYPATSCIWLGRHDDARVHAEAALTVYAAAPVGTQSPSREAIARLDLALAHAHLGSAPDAVACGVEALACGRVVDSVRMRAFDLEKYLAKRWPGSADAETFTDRLQATAG